MRPYVNSGNRLQVPVLLVVFNRPETTAAVLRSIREARPPALYIAGDGPRPSVDGDLDRCEAARRVATEVDWDCDVYTRFSDRNLGCAENTSTGITWFLENAAEGIILDDDCVPSRSFYRFCQELLEYYRNDLRIMHIAGNSHQYGRRRGSGSYYFSKYANFWGWATWSRAWRQFDGSLRPSWELQDDWSAPWQLSIERAGGITIVPNVNLVKNIGFGAGATHTHNIEPGAFVEAEEMEFPLIHPHQMRVDRAADVFTYYAHHRLVRHHRLVCLYWLRDQILFRLKSVKRWILRWLDSTARRSPGGVVSVFATGARVSLRDRLKSILKDVRIPVVRELIQRYFRFRRRSTEQARYARWLEAGRPAPPPPLYKQMIVSEAGATSGNRVLVETGTFEGQMVDAVASDYSRIYTIELDASLSAKASERFRGKRHITVLQGDSVEALPEVLAGLTEPAVFWLDAHFSGGATAGNADESPVMHELRAISAHPLHHQHVILIDDAREFVGGAYPSLKAVQDWAQMSGYDTVRVEQDIIRVFNSGRSMR